MRRKLLVAAGGAALVLGLSGAGVALAASGDDEGTVTGRQAETASTAALKATHGGTANAVERDGENGGYWEVEVTKRDGSTVDVRLDKSYQVVGIEGDGHESESGESEGGESESGESGG